MFVNSDDDDTFNGWMSSMDSHLDRTNISEVWSERTNNPSEFILDDFLLADKSNQQIPHLLNSIERVRVINFSNRSF